MAKFAFMIWSFFFLLAFTETSVIQHSPNNGDINVSQSASAVDKEGCGTVQTPCKTLPYAAKQCQSQSCNFIIDGGPKGRYGYVIPGELSFMASSMSVSIRALDENFRPTIVCNQTNRKDICFTASGRGVEVDSLVFVSTTSSGEKAKPLSSQPMIQFSSGAAAVTVTNCDFHSVSIGGFIRNLKNWYITETIASLGADAPVTMESCGVYGSSFMFNGDAPVTLQNAKFFGSNMTISQSQGGGGPINLDGSQFNGSGFKISLSGDVK